MRYYKIINKYKFKEALNFKRKLAQQEVDNINKIKQEITPFEWNKSLSRTNLYLIRHYLGFVPLYKLDAIPVGWKYDRDYKDVLVPNKVTKQGKQIFKKLNELPNYIFEDIYNVLDIEFNHIGRFARPQMLLSYNEKKMYLGLDREIDLDEKDFKEVTFSHVKKRLSSDSD